MDNFSKVSEFFTNSSEIESFFSTNKVLNQRTLKVLKNMGLTIGLSLALNNVNAQEIFNESIAQIQSTSMLQAIVAEHHIASFVDPKIHLVSNVDDDKDAASDAYLNKNNQCQVEITYSEQGGFANLAESPETISLSYALNERQQQMMREFELLHEEMHCRFIKFKNPIHPVGMSEEMTKKINDVFKSMPQNAQNPLLWENLNESFADTASLAALSYHYEYDNTTHQLIKDSDFERIKNIIILGREDEYFSHSGQEVDEHFTHFSLVELQKPENQEKLVKANTIDTFNNLILDIVNRGSEKLLSTRPIALDKMVSPVNFNNAIVLNILNILKEKAKTDYSDNHNIYHQIDRSGYSYQLAIDFIKRTHLDEAHLYDNKGQIINNHEFLVKFRQITNTLPVYENLPSVKLIMANVEQAINTYQDYVIQVPTVKNQRVELNMNKDDAKAKMANLREDFLNQNNTQLARNENINH